MTARCRTDTSQTGKELRDELSLGWLDYGAEDVYVPELGRWGSGGSHDRMGCVDMPSPYNYAFDNPMRFIDPDGMAPEGSGPCGDQPCPEKKEGKYLKNS